MADYLPRDNDNGVIEQAIAGALKPTSAVVVVSVEADGNVTFGYHILAGAPPDVLMRLLCGTNSAMNSLAQMIAGAAGEKVH